MAAYPYRTSDHLDWRALPTVLLVLLLAGCSRDSGSGSDAGGVAITRFEGGLAFAQPRSSAPDLPRNEETTGAGVVATSIRSVPPSAAAALPSTAPSECLKWKGRHDDAIRAKDYECVRGMLLPKLGAKTITTGEARYLRAACLALADVVCQRAVTPYL